ncbi:MAG TPA: asparaginase domain-containing protein [Steroidobacteraceae bacterium]|nr:asparaginase domain-containing protein [Steroidobacteraceae bacterium]
MNDEICIITTGGTIDKVYFDAKGGYEVGATMVRGILEHARVLEPVSIVELLRKDSLDMTAADRAAIRAAIIASPARRVLVTHGTDTMVETARELLDIGGKTIVLTGALQPGRMSDSDAPFNLGLAFGALKSRGPGVFIAANGHIFDATAVRKNRELNRFEAVDPQAKGRS